MILVLLRTRVYMYKLFSILHGAIAQTLTSPKSKGSRDIGARTPAAKKLRTNSSFVQNSSSLTRLNKVKYGSILHYLQRAQIHIGYSLLYKLLSFKFDKLVI